MMMIHERKNHIFFVLSIIQNELYIRFNGHFSWHSYSLGFIELA